MLPSMRQRLIIAAAIAVGVLGWLWVRPLLLPADGTDGLSLFAARAGLPMAVALVLVAGIPALVVGVVASATGNLLSGVFAAAAALCVLAGSTGPIDDWMWRAQLPQGYRGFIFEALIWQGLWAVMLAVIGFFRSPLRTRWPALAFTDHLGVDTRIRLPQVQALMAGLVSAVIGGVAAWLLVRSSDPGQVIGGLVIAFAVGGMLGHVVFPQTNPVGILLSPTLVAIASYGYVLTQFNSHEAVLQAWYTRTLFGPALAMPIYFASAGVAGCALGVGLAQALMSGDGTKAVERSLIVGPGAAFGMHVADKMREESERQNRSSNEP